VPKPSSKPNAAAPRRRALVPLLLVLLAGAGVRALYLAEAAQDPTFDHPAIDAGFHDYWARSLADPDWIPPEHVDDPEIETRAFLRPPGYPYFLAGVYAVTGGSPLAPRVLQMALGLASALLAWWIGRRWLGPAVGLAWCALMVLWWPLVYFEGELHAPALLIFLLLLLIRLLASWSGSPGVARALAAGLVLGAAALVRPNVLLFAPLALVWMLWLAYRREERFLPSGIALAVAVLAAIAPAAIRNARVAGDFVLVSSNLGINLYIGNNERATGFVAASLPPHGEFETCYDYPDVARSVERELGRPLKDSEVSAYFARKALDFARENPARFLALLARKAALFWGPDEISHNKVLALEREHSRVLRWLPGSFPLLVSGAIVGLVLMAAFARRRWPLAVLALSMIALWFLSVLPFFAASRYRAPILPLLMLFVAIGVCEIARLLRERRIGAAALGIGGWGLLLWLASWSPYDYQPDAAKWHMDRGRAFNRAGEAGRARREFEAALAAKPESAGAHFSLALTLGGQGRVAQAMEHYRLALAARPDHVRALNNLGSLIAQGGGFEEAIEIFQRALDVDPDQPDTRYNLGLACERAGRTEEAVGHYREALRLKPDAPKALRALAGTLSAAGRGREALEAWERLIEIEPGAADHRRNLVGFLATSPDEAVRDGERAVELARALCAGPGASRPENLAVLAAALAETGRFEEAVEAAERALGLAERAGQPRRARSLRAALELYRLGQPLRAGS